MSGMVTAGVKAASGYPQLSGVLTSPLQHSKMQERFRCHNLFQDITTSEYIGDIKSRGDTVTFMCEPEIRNHKLEKDGTIKHDIPEFKTKLLSIDCAIGFSVKFAMIDEYQIQDFDKIRSSILESASRDASDKVDCDILNHVYADAHPCNQGVSAGIESKCYNLGEVGAPLCLNQDNVLEFFASMQTVLDEQCVPSMDRWLVAPARLKNLVLKSELREACWSGLDRSTLLNGMMPNPIVDFNMYITNHLRKVRDPVTGDECYYLIAGHREALVYASQVSKLRVMQSHQNWDHFYQGMTVYGFGVVRPEALVTAYVKFDK